MAGVAAALRGWAPRGWRERAFETTARARAFAFEVGLGEVVRDRRVRVRRVVRVCAMRGWWSWQCSLGERRFEEQVDLEVLQVARTLVLVKQVL